jgi:hypothetical protein
MKGHRSRGRARRIVVAGHGRFVRGARDGATVPTIQFTAKEKQAARSRRAVVKMTPLGLLGRAARALCERVAAAALEASRRKPAEAAEEE